MNPTESRDGVLKGQAGWIVVGWVGPVGYVAELLFDNMVSSVVQS